MHPRTHLPFPALIGLETAQQALILLAIEPQLRGVVLAAPAGTGKSSLARGIRDILAGDNKPFIELPPSIDAENLLGGLDLDATLQRGEVVMQQGVLSRAHGGLVYVDGINLLTDTTANLLLSVLDNGQLHIEREGISQQAAARFSLIGSYDPAEGQPRQHLLDRIGLMAVLPGKFTAQQRAGVLYNNLLTDPHDWDDDVNFIRGMILAAREQLPHITITDEQVGQMCVLAQQYGVQGHRAELFAVRAACAAAAADLRDTVNDDDLELAAKLVILPRATRIPDPQTDQQQHTPPPPPSDQTPDRQSDQPPPPADQTADQPPPQQSDSPETSDDNDSDNTDDDTTTTTESIAPPEQILDALNAQLPDELDDLPYMNLRRGKSGSRGSTEGNRGRHVRSIPGSPSQGRIDIIGTLRAAAPWQRLRAQADRQPSSNASKNIYLDSSDVRIKQYRSKAGALFCFGVDASGSMALHRMRQAKGAVHALLERAYVNRDRVALMAFRGDEADLLLPPTQSVELARRALDLLPTGGGTPLASALLLACDIAEQAKMRGIMQTMLILLTDGRANVPYHEGADIQEEIQQLGGYVREAGVHVVIVDTKRSYLSRGEARQLADWLGGDYAYLPNAQGDDIADFVKTLNE